MTAKPAYNLLATPNVYRKLRQAGISREDTNQTCGVQYLLSLTREHWPDNLALHVESNVRVF